MKLNWYGWANSFSGYGIVSLEYATALNRIADVSIGWERREHVSPDDYKLFTDEQKKVWEKPFIKRRVGIIKTTPQMFFKNESEFRIGYTMVENTKIGEKWVEYCNKMNAMLVPSQFLVDVFKECGVKPPVVAVKQGVNIDRYKYYDRPKREKFVFGTIGYQDDRKNWEDLIVAFCSEFDKNEPVELWVKNSNPYFGHKAFNDPRIKVINKFYTFDQIAEFYRLLDCFVFPSHAEGSGLPPREAMATGLPTIVTNWSGLTEIADYGLKLEPVAIDHPDVRGEEQPGFMARIDVSELMYQMRYCYENQDDVKLMGAKASDFIQKNWNWDSCAADLLEKVKKLSNG